MDGVRDDLLLNRQSTEDELVDDLKDIVHRFQIVSDVEVTSFELVKLATDQKDRDENAEPRVFDMMTDFDDTNVARAPAVEVDARGATNPNPPTNFQPAPGLQPACAPPVHPY